jgi:hypothetical protein
MLRLGDKRCTCTLGALEGVREKAERRIFRQVCVKYHRTPQEKRQTELEAGRNRHRVDR